MSDQQYQDIRSAVYTCMLYGIEPDNINMELLLRLFDYTDDKLLELQKKERSIRTLKNQVKSLCIRYKHVPWRKKR